MYKLLAIVPTQDAEEYEYIYYRLLGLLGYELIQSESSFNYSHYTNYYNSQRIKNQTLKKYMQLRYKDTLIIIW